MFSNLNKEKLINYIIDILNEIKYFFDFFFLNLVVFIWV